jgi:hypothetical protein
MANSDKNIVIIPNVGSESNNPTINFFGANTTLNTQVTIVATPASNGTLSFEGSVGQLFSITNDMSNTIFSVNDVSGIPSIEVFSTGLIRIGQYLGNIVIGNQADNATDKLQIVGSLTSTGQIKSTIATGTAPFAVTSTTQVNNLNSQFLGGQGISYFGTATHTQAAFDRSNTDVTSASVTAGSYGSSTVVPTITLAANGRVVAVSTTSIPTATTGVYGLTILSTSVSSTSTTVAATSSAVRDAYNYAGSAYSLASSAQSLASQAASTGKAIAMAIVFG